MHYIIQYLLNSITLVGIGLHAVKLLNTLYFVFFTTFKNVSNNHAVIFFVCERQFRFN